MYKKRRWLPGKEDRAAMEDAFKEAAKAVEVMITEGMDTAMNQFNGHKA